MNENNEPPGHEEEPLTQQDLFDMQVPFYSMALRRIGIKTAPQQYFLYMVSITSYVCMTRCIHHAHHMKKIGSFQYMTPEWLYHWKRISIPYECLARADYHVRRLRLMAAAFSIAPPLCVWYQMNDQD